MSSQNYKENQAVRELQRCEATVVRDGQEGFCDRPLDERGQCLYARDHKED